MSDAARLSKEIETIFAERGLAAARSEYDRSVCVEAVRAARLVFESVPVVGDGPDYVRSVLAALAPLYETYHDPDGVYTSGRGVIGDVYGAIGLLLD